MGAARPDVVAEELCTRSERAVSCNKQKSKEERCEGGETGGSLMPIGVMAVGVHCCYMTGPPFQGAAGV